MSIEYKTFYLREKVEYIDYVFSEPVSVVNIGYGCTYGRFYGRT